MVGVFGASRALLRVLALIGLVADLLAVIALLWPWPVFKCSCRAGLSSSVEEAFRDDSSCLASLSQVYQHCSVGLRNVLIAQPCDFCNCRSIFFAKRLSCSYPDVVVLI